MGKSKKGKKKNKRAKPPRAQRRSKRGKKGSRQRGRGGALAGFANLARVIGPIIFRTGVAAGRRLMWNAPKVLRSVAMSTWKHEGINAARQAGKVYNSTSPALIKRMASGGQGKLALTNNILANRIMRNQIHLVRARQARGMWKR